MARFVELAEAVAENKRWNQSWSIMSFAALGLLSVASEARALADIRGEKPR